MSGGAWQVEAAHGRGALEALLADWRELEGRCASITPFQSPEWLLPWWHCFGHGELRVVSVRCGGVLHALVPLLVEQTASGRRVTLLGTGNTDHLDALVADDAREAAGALAVAGLARLLGDGDRCDLEQLGPESPLLTVPAPAAWQWETRQCDVCPVLRLPPSVREVPDVVPPRLLANLRYARRRIERLGPVCVERASPENLPELLGALFALHRARWAARGLPGVLGDDVVRAFHERVAEGFLARGVLRMYALRVAGRIVAVYYGFSWKARTYYYLGGFEPSFASCSVGSLLVEHAIHEAVREGVPEFDFLRGGEPYKYRWGATDRPSYRRTLRRAAAAAAGREAA